MNNITSIWTSVPAPTAWPAVKFTADGLMPNVLHHAIRLTYFATLSSKPFWTPWNSADSSRATEFPSIHFPIKVYFLFWYGALTFSPIPGVAIQGMSVSPLSYLTIRLICNITEITTPFFCVVYIVLWAQPKKQQTSIVAVSCWQEQHAAVGR